MFINKFSQIFITRNLWKIHINKFSFAHQIRKILNWSLKSQKFPLIRLLFTAWKVFNLWAKLAWSSAVFDHIWSKQKDIYYVWSYFHFTLAPSQIASHFPIMRSFSHCCDHHLIVVAANSGLERKLLNHSTEKRCLCACEQLEKWEFPLGHLADLINERNFPPAKRSLGANWATLWRSQMGYKAESKRNKSRDINTLMSFLWLFVFRLLSFYILEKHYDFIILFAFISNKLGSVVEDWLILEIDIHFY